MMKSTILRLFSNAIPRASFANVNSAEKNTLRLLEQLRNNFTSELALEVILKLNKSLPLSFNKSDVVLELSKMIVQNIDKCDGIRYHMNQLQRRYIMNKWPAVPGFVPAINEYLITQFETNYLENDEGHNLFQFFRCLTIDQKDYANIPAEQSTDKTNNSETQKDKEKQMIIRIAKVFEKEHLRFNLKHSIISLYYANKSGEIRRFESLVNNIRDLYMFADLSLFSTLCLITTQITDKHILSLLFPIFKLIQDAMPSKQNDMARNLSVTRLDVLADFLSENDILTPEFKQFYEATRQKLMKYGPPKSPFPKFTLNMTQDQQESFEPIIQKFKAQNQQQHSSLTEGELSFQDDFIEKLLNEDDFEEGTNEDNQFFKSKKQ